MRFIPATFEKAFDELVEALDSPMLERAKTIDNLFSTIETDQAVALLSLSPGAGIGMDGAWTTFEVARDIIRRVLA